MPDAPRRLPVAEILALSALAIGAPLLEVLSRQSAFFVAHRSTPGEIAAFTALVFLGPPLVLTALAALGRRVSPRLGRVVADSTLALLVTLLVAAPAKRLGLAAAAAIALAVLAGVGAALALRRSDTLRRAARLLAVLSLAIPLRFLFFSPVAELVRPSSVELPRVEVAEPVPVVLLILDELPLVSLLDRDRGIDAAMFPHFARLARRSHWFRNATAVSPLTDFAVPALLTGRRPRDVAPIAAEYPVSLFTLLAGSHRMEVIETQTRLCPSEVCAVGADGAPRGPTRSAGLRSLLADATVAYLHIVTPRPLDGRLPSIATAWGGFLAAGRSEPSGRAAAEQPTDEAIKYHIWASDRGRDFESFLDRLRPSDEPADEPTLYFFHAMLPHVPWVYLPSGREYWGSLYSSAHAPGVAADTTWTTAAWLVEQAWQRHLAQVAYVDALLGRLLDRLEETGLDRRALLVVVSDHGFAFQPGQPGRHPTRDNYAEILPVPLFVRLPGQREGSVSDRNVETIDVLPTIADLLGVEPAPSFDGASVFAGGPERPTKTIAATPTEPLTFDDADLDRKYQRAESKLALFAGGLFSIGPHPSLLGRHVGELSLGEPTGIEVRLPQAEHYRDVDPSGPFVPAQIFGRLRRDRASEGDLTLALAVNGVVRAVTRAFDERGDERFVALVPEESFVAGPNTVDVFLVEDGSGGAPTLRATVASSAPRYGLELGSDGRTARLVADDGSACELDPAAVRGGFARHGTGFHGWAVDASGARPNVIIMVFADGRAVYATSTGTAPASLFELPADSTHAAAGFQFSLPGALVERTRELRVFAVLGPTGTELGPLPERSSR